ncbi:unnamed protein product [Cladocopium goreaui]|uniref:Pentatricopeptide repeat-containing protein n=1 Tax=Cladocopium goreaui TaxID=2562237 RepID=A0A9P1DU66_9DINO|nr:unnamed protein product [Cladocopium goreaui]
MVRPDEGVYRRCQAHYPLGTVSCCVSACLNTIQEVVTTNTNKVIAAIPSAAKSRPRAKRKAKQESAVADVPTVDLSENGHDVSAPAAEKQPKLQAEAILDAATAEDKEVVTTNTNKVIAAIPSAAKSRPRAKRKAKQEESAVADVPTVDLSENGHDVSAPAAEKQPKLQAEAILDAATAEDKVVVTTNTNKVIAAIASAAKLRPRAKRKAKQEDEAPLVTDAAEPFPAKPAANGVTNGAPEHLKEPILESALMVNLEDVAGCNLQETKPVETETAAKARPRAKRKAKQVESKMVAEASENLPKEVDEKSAEKPSEAECSKEEGKKKSEAAPKRPRAKRKAKKAEDAIVIDDAEPCLSPDTNGVTNGEQHSEEQAASTSTVTDDAKAVANTVPENQAAEDLAKDGVEPEASTLSSGTAEPPQADFFVPEAALFQPLGDPDSPQEQAFEAPPGPDPLKEAEEVLSELLQQQALMCKEVRISIEDRLQEVFEEWRCLHNRINTSAEYCVRQVLDAVSQNQHADATTLGLAIEEAQQLGLPERKAITERLEELKKLEEVEGVWQCLSTCLRDADRLGVVFWSKEAEDLGLEVPEVLMPALDAMRDEEAARLKRMELEASFNAQAAEAHAHKDVQALQAMAQHAKASGQDPSAALAALEDLGAEEAEEEELERLFVSSPNGQNHCFGMYVLVKEERGNGMPVWRQLGGERWIYTDELGRWTVGSSKVRQNGFRGSAGFIFCPQKNHGVLPDKMQFWARFDEEAKKWKKDQRRGPPYVRHRHETQIFLLPILCVTICQNEPFGLSTSC